MKKYKMIILLYVVILNSCFLNEPLTSSTTPELSELKVIKPRNAFECDNYYFPIEKAFNLDVKLDENSFPTSYMSDNKDVWHYKDRYAYIDFSDSYSKIEIHAIWTLYRAYTKGNQGGYEELWWDDDNDDKNDNGIVETIINFNSANINDEDVSKIDIWIKDVDLSLNPIIPKRRYLIVKTGENTKNRVKEYAIVGKTALDYYPINDIEIGNDPIPPYSKDVKNMSYFMGTCIDITPNNSEDMSKLFGWVRIYLNWDHFERYRDDNYIFTGAEGWIPNLDTWFTEFRTNNIDIVPTFERGASWLAGPVTKPYSSGFGSYSKDYAQRAEFAAQFMARYGSKKVDTSLLETDDKISGLNLVKFFEDGNEQDQTWDLPRWSAYDYGKSMRAVYNGYGITTDNSIKIAGIKNVDPDSVYVYGGLYQNGLDGKSGAYLTESIESAGGQYFDVINMHQYWFKDNISGVKGTNPEIFLKDEVNSDNVSSVKKLITWRDNNAPNKEVWMTEFGYDTKNPNSRYYAPEQQQANYLLRGFAILKGLGFDRASMFWFRDSDKYSMDPYGSCGVVKNKDDNYEKKISYYYLATMKNVIGDLFFSRIIKNGVNSDGIEEYIYEFKNDKKTVLMAWIREKGSFVDSGITKEVTFNINVSKATKIEPIKGSLTGSNSNLEVKNSLFKVKLSETPIFIEVE